MITCIDTRILGVWCLMGSLLLLSCGGSSTSAGSMAAVGGSDNAAGVQQLVGTTTTPAVAEDGHWRQTLTLLSSDVLFKRSGEPEAARERYMQEVNAMWHFELEVLPLSVEATDSYKGSNPFVKPLSWDSLRYFMARDMALVCGEDTLDAGFCHYVEDGKIGGRLRFLIDIPKDAKQPCDRFAFVWQDRFFGAQRREFLFEM